MRALEPHRSDYTVRDGVRVHFEVFGTGATTVLLLPPWSIVHSRAWKAQVAYLARHYRVITFDGRGNGLSDRPAGAEAYLTHELVADAVAVMNATDTPRAVIIGFSLGGHVGANLAARHPERVVSAMLIAPAAPFGGQHSLRDMESFLVELGNNEGWARFNYPYWQRDLRGFAEFFFSQCMVEPHSTKQIEDAVGWALETSAETLRDTMLGRYLPQEDGEQVYRLVNRPTLVVHGTKDRIVPIERGQAVASVIGAPLVTLEGSGHLPIAREPVLMNLLMRDFIDRTCATPPKSRTLHRAATRHPRALYLSSPIGLGHARRDLAIARQLRTLRPQLEIDWLTQHPVTGLLERAGETVHPASRLLVSESAHIEHEAGEHDLHVFQALRRMDEILVANFMLFQELVEDGHYDVVIADEAWDVDHFWHEHPQLKRSALAWFTDFVGYMPMPEGGDHERFLTSDYNAEMLEHIERHPSVRDRSIFVGNPVDIVPGTFGNNLPQIRAWTEQHFDFCGYITGREPGEFGDRESTRQQFGFRADEKVCIVTVGGSGVGEPLLRRIINASADIRRRVPELRMIVVAGPRIDVDRLPRLPGVEIRGYVPDLDRQLAVCDIALVQGGLTTCMELAAASVPFLYFPLKNHFEQNVHVRHRLERYGAGRCMNYADAVPEVIAAAIVEELGRSRRSLAVESDGALRAARLIADLI